MSTYQYFCEKCENIFTHAYIMNEHDNTFIKWKSIHDNNLWYCKHCRENTKLFLNINHDLHNDFSELSI